VNFRNALDSPYQVALDYPIVISSHGTNAYTTLVLENRSVDIYFDTSFK